MHFFREQSMQLLKSVSVEKEMPDEDLIGSIRKLSVNVMPMLFSGWPRRENIFSCSSRGQFSREPGHILAVRPGWKRSARSFSKKLTADLSAISLIASAQ